MEPCEPGIYGRQTIEGDEEIVAYRTSHGNSTVTALWLG